MASPSRPPVLLSPSSSYKSRARALASPFCLVHAPHLSSLSHASSPLEVPAAAIAGCASTSPSDHPPTSPDRAAPEIRRRPSSDRWRRSSPPLPHSPRSLHPEHHGEVRKPPLFLFHTSWCLAPSPPCAVRRRPPRWARSHTSHQSHPLEPHVELAFSPAPCRCYPRRVWWLGSRFCVRQRTSDETARSSCSSPWPPDHRWMAPIKSGHTPLARSILDQWTKSTSAVHGRVSAAPAA
jgi:hypothetical protein